jgi:hypothetical protein
MQTFDHALADLYARHEISRKMRCASPIRKAKCRSQSGRRIATRKQTLSLLRRKAANPLLELTKDRRDLL